MSIRAWHLAPLLSVLACGSGAEPASSRSQSGGGAAASGTSSGSSSVATTFSAAQVAAAKAACDADHGTVLAPATFEQFNSKFVGAWYPCSASSPLGGTPDFPVQPVAFTEDGRAQFLVPDGSGGLVAGRGLAYQGTYSVLILCRGGQVSATDTCDTPEVFHPIVTLNGGYGWSDSFFETQPTRLEIQDETYQSGNWTFWYVPLNQK